jgi:predicted Zn-dependent peptidase
MTGTAVRAAAALIVAGATAAPRAGQGPDRSAPPATGPAPHLELPSVQKRTLSNGLPVWLVESHEVPLVQVNLVVHAGAGDDPAGRFGVAGLTSAMLDEGAGGRTALELADEIEFLGASLATTSSFDASAVRLNVPVARLAAALPLMADVALHPTFPQVELDRLRQERLTALLQARDDPASVAPMAFARVVFGAGHRYGTGTTGTEAALKSFTTEDLRAFHAAWYRPSNATLIVVGGVTVAAVLDQLERHFGAWRGAGPVARVPVPVAAPIAERHVLIVDMPGAEQSEIRIGAVGVPRSTPDYFALQVLNTVLGGSFTSRLNQNLREKHGYTYGAGSRFEMRLSSGAFMAGAGVQTDKTAEALAEFFKELRAILEPIGDEELARAKNYLALGFPAEFETIGDLSGHLEEIAVYGLPDDYFSRYVAGIQAVAAAAVQKAAAARIRPERMAVVVAGDRKVIESPIRALALGPLRVVTVDDALRDPGGR